MSPIKIDDERRDKHWSAMLAVAANLATPSRTDEVARMAWEMVQAHYEFLAAKEREGNGIPQDDEEDGA